MPKSLVIVESPAKARTIAGFLGSNFVVESSIGHIRDLPKNASDIPAAYKKEPWARLGVDVDHDFKPLYVVAPEKKQHIGKLKSLLSGVDALYLATDEDREGESIAWHLLEVLGPTVPVQRMVFHEITKRAIEEAIEHPRALDRRLVDAQEARRILDRLYGYEVSPVLWKKIMPRLSAGRVQSVATRMVVERERERMSFEVASYWSVDGDAQKREGENLVPPVRVPLVVVAVDGARVATGKDFGDDGKLQKSGMVVLDQAIATSLAQALGGAAMRVESVERKPLRRAPYPPFMTSTLQQEASRKLKFTAARTMRAAQRLYENGYITYMRTDSTTLSDAAVSSARSQIHRMYGAEYLPPSPRSYNKKVKNAQEAHEAIRPAGEVFRLPDEVAREVEHDESRLYELIWMRTIASQMQDARMESVSVRVSVTLASAGDPAAPAPRRLELLASGNSMVFAGFLRAYVEGSDDPEAELENRERHLPQLAEGEILEGLAFVPKAHETLPPARYTEASLVRRLEEEGVGRPSTYASIISTILERGYVWKKGTALVPSFKAFAVVALLEQHFGQLVDYAFTARMEDELDAIANGEQEAVPWLRRFYFGGGDAPGGNGKVTPERGGPSLGVGLRSLVADRLSEIDARAINSVSLGKDPEGRELVVRVGRFGTYLQRGEETASLGDDIAPDELTPARAVELIQAPSGDRVVGDDPDSGLPILVRNGRYGPYLQLGEGGKKERPKTKSLLRAMTPQSLTLEDALKLLSLPRTLGKDPSDGEEIVAELGRYGAYIQKGSDSRSLEREELVFTVGLEEALAMLAQPRQRPRRAEPEPIRELGVDSVSGKVITLRAGRFGPYVTDGDVNASLRTADDPDALTPARAQELLQLRRERGPSKKKVNRRKDGAGSSKVSKSGAASARVTQAGAKLASSKKKSTEEGSVRARAKKVSGKKAAKGTASSEGASRVRRADGEGSAPVKARAAKSGAAKSGAAKARSEKSGSEKSGSEKSGSEKSGSEKSGSEKSGPKKPAPKTAAAKKARVRKSADSSTATD